MIPFTPDDRRAQFAPSQNVGGAVDRDVLDIIGAQPQPTMAAQVDYDVPNIKPVDPDVVDIVNQSQVPLMSSLMGASRVNPDQAAEAKRLGSQIGVGQDIALRNMDEVRQRAFMAEVQRRDIARANPVLAGFLSDRTFANEASDDIGVLANIEKAWSYLEELPGEFMSGVRTGQIQVDAGKVGSTALLRGSVTEDEQRQYDAYQKELQKLAGEPGFWREAGTFIGQMERTGEDVVKGAAVGGVAGGGAALVAGQLGPQIFLPEEIVTVPAGVMFGIAAGATSAMFTSSARTMAGLNYMKNLEAGMNPGVSRATALGVGVIGGAFEAYGAKLVAAPFKSVWTRLVSEAASEAVTRPTVGKAVANAGLAYATGVGGEIGTEVAQQVTEIAFDEIAGFASDPEFQSRFATAEGRQGIKDELRDVIVRTALGISVIGGIGPGANLYVDTRRAGKAVKSQQAIQNTVDAINAAKLKQRDPAALEQFGDAALRSTTAFIRGTTMQSLVEASKVSRSELDAIIPGLSGQIQEAVNADNFVSLPLAQFGVRLAGTPLGDAMQPHMTIDPNAMTPTELEAFRANVEQFTELAATEYEAKTEAESAFVQEADQVFSSMRERLVAAGRDPALADIEALMHQAFVVTQAANRNMTPTQFEAESGLREIVGAEMPAAPIGPTVPTLEQANRDIIESVDAELGGIMDAAKEASRAAGKTKSKDTQAAAFKAKQEWIAANPARYEEYQAAQRIDALERERIREAAESALAGKIDESLATAAKTLTDAGFVLDYESVAPSKSRYYRKGNTLIRLSDHEIPVTPERAAAREAGVQVPYRDFVFDGTAVDAELIQDLEEFAARTSPNIMEQASRLDADYMAAVERGDMEAAQRMVDEAARSVGLTELVWRGDRAGAAITQYRRGARREPGIFTTTTQEIADKYAGGAGLARQFYVGGRTLDLTTPTAETLQWIRQWAADAEWDFVDRTTGEQIAPEDAVMSGLLFDWEGTMSGARWKDIQATAAEQGYDIVKLIDMDEQTFVSTVVLNENRIKSADPITRDEAGNIVPLSRRFDITSPRIFEQAPVTPGFYSALEREVTAIDSKALTAAGWGERLKGLVNKGAIKADELEWSGLNDYLKMQEGKVSKDAVLEFLRGNGVRVEQIDLGTRSSTIKWVVTDDNMDGESETFASEAEAEAAADERRQEAEQRVRENSELQVVENEDGLWEVYKDSDRLPGRYRTQAEAEGRLQRRLQTDINFAISDISVRRVGANRILEQTKYEARTLPGGTNYREILLKLPDDALGTRKIMEGDKVVAIAKNDPFRSSHWDQPNVLVHLRMNDRVDTDGKRVLFVEEVQSDWGQQGRKVGFVATALRRQEIEQEYRDAEAAVATATPETRQAAQERFDVAMDVYNAEINNAAIPRAPFVENTDGWLNLGLKQIMLEAVRGGYDSVAFVNGEQSADRYDLAKQVSLVSVNKQADGRFLTYIEGIDGTALIRNRDGFSDAGQKAMTAEELEATVGKEVAKQAIEGKPNKDGWVDVRGDNLRVGGEGMEAFYDTIVPIAMGKLLKKYGGGKLTDIVLPNMRQKEMEADAERMGMNVAAVLDLAEDTEYAQAQPGFDITPELGKKLATGLPLFQAMPGRGPARGGYDPSRLKILFGKGADFTTGAHELTHYYVDYYTKQAMAGTAAPQMLADLDAMFKFMGVAGDTPEARLAAFNAMPFETARPLIETITYNAEVYLFEGKAPSLELAGVFDRMLAFFRRAYKSLADFVTQQQEIYRREFGRELPVLNDDLRAVFDRMLADERQIKQAQAVAQMRGQFTVKPEGMDDAEWAAYQEMAGEATNAAIADMTKASLRQMEWLSRARNRIVKELQARHTAQRKEVRERVQKEVQQEPLYRAMAFLRRGQVVAPDGTVTEAEGVHRIDRVLAAEFAPTVDLAALGGRYGVLQDDGLHPDIVAEMFGYPTGGTLLEALAAAKPMREAVEDQTDAEMLRLYGEMNTPEAREQEIQKALHNEARARLVGVELRFMGKIQQPVRVLMEAARQAAKQVIDRKRVGELRPSEFVAAEAKASREATAAMQDNKPDVAFRAKRAQLLNNQLAKAALEVKDEIDAALKDFRKFFRADSKIADSRDLAMVMAARSILASRGIGQSDKAPSAYIEQLKANNPGVYAELEPIITQGGVGDYRQMTVAEFRVLAESVNALWTRARRDRQIQVEDRKVAIDTVITKLKEALSKITRPEVQPGVSKAVGPADVAKRRLMEIRAAGRRIESWADAIDGSDPNRPVTTYVWQLVRDATTRFRQIRNDKIKILDGLVRGLTMPTKSIAAPELGYTFGAGNSGVGKAELLGAMLHTGNISNYRKLLLGRGWASMDDAGNMNDANWRRFVARMISEGILTKEDFDFLQAVWDLNEDIKPLLQKTYYDMEGYYFKEVPASPVVTPFGTYRGGYVPAATDKFMVADAAQKAGMEELEQDWRFSLPSTGMGMTKSRVESYLRPLALDVRQTVAHVDAALRFAIIQPAISDVLKILKNRSFAEELNAIDPTAISDMLLPWLNRAARQTVSQPGRSRLMDAVWTGVRTRTGMAIMFGNIRNALQNLTGYFPAALKVKPTYLKNAMATYLGAPRETASMIAATDPYMDQRMRDQVYEMQERMNDLLINPSKFAKIKAWNKQHAYFLQTAFQNQVDIVVWLGAYNQSLAESGVGVGEDKARKQAIRDAGAAVRLTQGSMLPEDIAAFEAGTPFYRTFTQFASYFNGIANLNVTEFIKTVRAMGFRGGKGKLLYIYMLGVMMPAIVSDAIVRSLGGGWEDDDEDGYLDVYMDWFFGSQLRMGAAFVPFGASAYRLVAAPFTTETYDDRMTSSPSVSAIEAATVGTGKAIINVFDEEKEVTGKNVRDVLTAISLATGVPVSAAGKPIGYLVDVARGKIEPEGPIDFVRGLVTGTATPSSRRR